MIFAQFFETLWNKKPFPWQERLAELAIKGTWPESIGLPTASGKTALIDIAVFALAKGAPHAARRIFFVVDRRVIVDEAARRAQLMAEKLSKADPTSDLGKLAQALRELGGRPDPLQTAILRGGIPRDSWTDSPIQPNVICSTVDQIGSSLLFRAYGASEYGWPIRAGLGACDSLIILDEAHTSQPFAETLTWIRKYRSWAEQPIDLPFTVVEMSATPRDGRAFEAGDKDREDPVLKRRWKAEKHARLIEEKPEQNESATKGEFTALVGAFAREARSMRDRGAKVIGVIANRVMTARRVHGMLKDDEGCDAILLTGRARPYDRDKLWTTWEPRIGLDRGSDPERPVFVVATQCIEVGANIDFDALVTEVASLDALEQRFGRLDRNGRLALTHAAIVAQKDQTGSKNDDAIYGSALAASWKWLEEHQIQEERFETAAADGKKKRKTKQIKEKFVRMGVLALRQALSDTTNRAELVMPRQSAPVLMPAHMDLLCQTSPEPALSPEPGLFLHGPETGPADVQVIWRQDLGEDTSLWGDIAAICPPAAAEAVSVPVWAVRKWLLAQDAPILADIEGLREEEFSGRSERRPVLRWQGPDDSQVLERTEEIRPGMTVVVPATYGGCDEWGWNPASEQEVVDVGDPVKLRTGHPILRLHPKLVESWNDAELSKRLAGVESVVEARSALGEPTGMQAAGWVRDTVSALRSSRILKLVDSPGDGDSSWAAITGKGTFDQGSYQASYTTEVRLDAHLAGCEQWAKIFARGLPENISKTVIHAAALHDIGKADPRFQAWLRGGNPVKPDELIAKSGRSGQNRVAIERARRLACFPKGGRHELLSVALIEGCDEVFDGVDFDLLLHLVASHHGRCRPFAAVVADDNPVQVHYKDWQASSDHRLESIGSGVCERFWRLTRRYGWHGLAYLEALEGSPIRDRARLKRITLASMEGQLMHEVELAGLDGGNFLGFLAALGTLRVLTLAEPEAEVRMSWADKGSWRPVVYHSRIAEGEEMIEVLARALTNTNTGFSRDFLDLPLQEFAMQLKAVASERGTREVADFLTALGSDCFPERRGEKKPATTQLRAIGGGNNAGFLGIMRFIHTQTTSDHLQKALFRSWDYSDPNPFLRWDPNEYRPHALRALAPADDKKRTTVRGANRLAIEGLPMFPTVPLRHRLRTTGFDDDDQMSWPIWVDPMNLKTIASVLAMEEVQSAERFTMERRGIAQVFRARRFTDAQYRNFSPAKSLL